MKPCPDCGSRDPTNCSQEMITLNKIEYRRIPYALVIDGEETSAACQDCGVGHGGYHHKDCPSELCPKCGGRLLFCLMFDAQHKHSGKTL